MKDSKHDILFELLVCIAAAMVLGLFIGYLYTREPAKIPEDQRTAYDYPVAGITEYLTHLAKHSLALNEPSDSDISELEAFFDSVGCSESDEPEEPYDIEEEVIVDGSDSLELYFGYTPSDDELDLWQRVVMAECGYTEPDSGIIAVADCIANRCRSSRFPNTITEVVYQRNQFETVTNGSIWKYQVTDRVLDICADTISEGATYDYLFFTAGGYNPYCQPGGVIGHHYFGW